MGTKKVILRPKEARRITSGHLWVFSNEVQSVEGNPRAGDVVDLHAAGGEFIGRGFYHPHSLITVRLLTREAEEIDFGFFERRISAAAALRARLYPNETTYRLVHGESDFLPGLVIDRYNDIFAIQTYSAGMYNRITLIADVLQSAIGGFHPLSIIERNESPLLGLELLPERSGILRGKETSTTITEHGILYRLDVLKGQKTGFFLDQRENRYAFRRYVQGCRVLDAFTNDGGFALNAAMAGAREVIGLDISESAIERAKHNARLNRVADRCTFLVADVFEELPKLVREVAHQGKFDVINLDPPALTKSKKNLGAAKHAYKELNSMALQLLSSGGILATSSCSHHVDDQLFFETIVSAARQAHRQIRLLDWRGASPDHPVLSTMPETRYLKFAVFVVD
ncbi:MAG: class I SAM-dependent rRNA methyltransferase [Bacteroidota bacterium]